MIIAIIIWTILGFAIVSYLQGSDMIDIRECSVPARIFLCVIGGPITIAALLFGYFIGGVLIVVAILDRMGDR